ncbi:hypothetical protein Clacol_008279 [Clathrus columnatus]|uniref:Nudix hydrolase domain-containing protein n=1 Tax=Clathrus columnatus TaxID=1419009 RepID=A0AAV5AK25_9AGAM|nr:hypothetical protein Clacol_008279 [Clathrus columnatus]
MFRRPSKRSSTSQHSHARSPHRQEHPPEFIPEPVILPPLSEDSSAAVEDSIWFCHDFILGAGTVIIQPTTKLIVLIYHPGTKTWFLPKGRKDTGESLEQAALREAYEESGYRAKFLPLALPSLAPLPPSERKKREEQDNPNTGPYPSRGQSAASTSAASSASRPPLELNTEPIYMTTQCAARRRNGTLYEYITYWYVAFIEEDAEREEDTGMPDEKDYESYLVSYEEAMKRLGGVQKVIVDRAYKWWRRTEEWVEEELVDSVARLGGHQSGRGSGHSTHSRAQSRSREYHGEHNF